MFKFLYSQFYSRVMFCGAAHQVRQSGCQWRYRRSILSAPRRKRSADLGGSSCWNTVSLGLTSLKNMHEVLFQHV